MFLYSLVCITLAAATLVSDQEGEVNLPSALPQYEDEEETVKRFAEFKLKYKKLYSAEDDKRRFDVFKHNMIKAKFLQANERGTAKFGVTKFSDLTEEEFLHRYGSIAAQTSEDKSTSGLKYNQESKPSEVDWRDLGAVSSVKDQLQCGSSWAFSAIGAVEGQWFQKNGTLHSLSAQQLVDCDILDAGCKGGFPTAAYEAIKMMGGIQSEEGYPYTGEEESCQVEPREFVAHVSDTVCLSHNEEDIAAWMADNGPVSMAFNMAALQNYESGILHPETGTCNPVYVTSAGLGVGYGVENGIPYWIVKNSWGVDWGEQGYVRFYRGDGTCGINRFPNAPVVS